MKQEIITCDNCGKECNNYATIYVSTTSGGTSRNDLCIDCYKVMLDALKKQKEANT